MEESRFLGCLSSHQALGGGLVGNKGVYVCTSLHECIYRGSRVQGLGFGLSGE